MFKLIAAKLDKEITAYSADILEQQARRLHLKRKEYKIIFVCVSL